MIYHFLKVIVRNIKGQKLYSAINILGLSIGIASFLIILLYVVDEVSYDTFHEDVRNLYRVAIWKDVEGLHQGQASVPFRTAEVLLNDYPEIIQASRMVQLFQQDPVVQIGDERYLERRFYFAEQSIFDVLTIPFIKGDPRTALSQPHSVVLTEETAMKYFGRLEILDQVISINLNSINRDFRVTGILQNCPENTHFKYDLLVPLDDYWPVTNPLFTERLKTWYMLPFWTYIKAQKGTKVSELDSKLERVIQNYFPVSRQNSKLFLQPVKDIHLFSQLDNELEPNGNIVNVTIFSGIAFIVLLAACINFMNLSAARAIQRAREVGLRKVMGASRSQLMKQFLSESMGLTMMAAWIAAGLLVTFVDILNRMALVHLDLYKIQGRFFLYGIIGVLFVGLASGIYPAFILSSHRPIKTVRGSFSRSRNGKRLRRTLVVLQMGITDILLINVMILFNQLKYIENKELGFKKNQIMLITAVGTRLADNRNYEAFKDRLMQYPEVMHITRNNQIPGQGATMRAVYFNAVSEEERKVVPFFYVGHDFATTYGLEIVQGRDISRKFVTDSNWVYLVNESVVEQFGLEPVIGREITTGDRELRPGPIVGVVKDFHHGSLHETIGPLIMGLWNVPLPHISVKIQPKSIPETIKQIEEIWNEFESHRKMEYSFLDDRLNALYASETRMGRVVALFTGMAMIIACLGLLGMSLHVTQRRMKEAGIRKVLGGSALSIVHTFSFDILKNIVVANLIAWPTYPITS